MDGLQPVTDRLLLLLLLLQEKYGLRVKTREVKSMQQQQQQLLLLLVHW